MPLTTTDKCKAYLGVSYIDTTDDFLNDLIDSVQGEIENYCNRSFDLQTYTAEQHEIMHKVFPNNYPIVSVQAIRRIGPDVFSLYYTSGDDNTINNFRVYPAYIEMLDMKYVTMGNKIMWGNHEASYVEVDYTAGYDATNMPKDLSLAATKLVAWEYKQSRENRLGIETEKEGGVQYIYSKTDLAIPAQISSILDRYSKIRV
jgi:hypothetical protein